MTQTTNNAKKGEFMTSKEVAELLGYSVGGFRNMISNTHALPVYKVSKTRNMYKRSDVEKFLEDRRIAEVMY